MNDVINKVSDTLTGEPVLITVDVTPKNFLYKLWYGKRKRKKVFTIHLITPGNMIRISKLLNSIDNSLYDLKENGNILDSNWQAIEKYTKVLVEITAIAITNKKEMPPKSLIDFIEYNFTAAELYSVLAVVIKQMDVASFMSTIISVKGLNILVNQDASVRNANGIGVSH